MQRAAANLEFPRFVKGVNYKAGDIGDNLFDALNSLLIQDNIITRNGMDRFTTEAFTSNPQSMTFYQNNLDARRLIVKAGTTMYSGSSDAVFTAIKTGLSSAGLHDAVTMNGRHIIVTPDGLFSYNGTTFANIGIDAPTAPTIAANNGSGTLLDKAYTVAITYEATGIGFESNIGTSSNIITTAGGDDSLDVSAIPVSAHPLVDKKNIYLRNVTDSGNYLFVGQIDNGTTIFNIPTNPSAASDTPPTGKDAPISGGGKYCVLFQDQFTYTGNSNFPSDVYRSEPGEPDAYPTSIPPIVAQGNGAPTGLAVGLFNNSVINQYLVIFKKRSFTVYFEDLNGDATQIFFPGTGCVSHRSIRAKDGDIYFLSDFGWRMIKNARLEKDTLASGNIDDIFKENGGTYGLNKSAITNSFSVYYQELDSYMSWVPEGSQTSLSKCYNYHIDKNEFMPLMFLLTTCAVEGEDEDGNETVFMGNEDGHIYRYDIRTEYKDDITSEGFVLDVDQLDIDTIEDDSQTAISTFVVFAWNPKKPFDTTFNFRDFWIEGLSQASSLLNSVTVKAFLNFSRSTVFEFPYDFYTTEGFVLDMSRLDQDILGDDRSRSRIFKDLNITSRNILLGIYQNVLGSKLRLIASQLNVSKNGNANI